FQKLSPSVIGVAGSVSIEETHHKLIRQSTASFGHIDVWINNAGIPQTFKEFREIGTDEIHGIINTNIAGLLMGTKIVVNHMLEQGYGKIFNVEGFGSDGRTMNKLTLYGTTKRAVNYFTKSFSKEMKNTGVQVGILSPGMVRTDFLDPPGLSDSPEDMKRFEKVYDILAEEVDVVSKFLVRRILQSTGNYDRIEYLTKSRLAVKMLKMLFR
ncbi:hypothetical protein LCGC14_3115960, partial [marine sediment metagenome]